jgi:putative SOS response-associated peptidase YedK
MRHATTFAPTDPVPFVTIGENGAHKLREGRWWLVPWWAKEMPKAAMFNARIETVDSGNAFKDAFRNSRCLIPADGYYEWTKSPADGGKDPWHIYLRDHEPFSFAGLWAHNKALDITSYTIITGPAEEPTSRLHHRQPIMLDPAVYDAWVDPETPADEVKGLLSQRVNGECQFNRVGRDVNTAAINKQPNGKASMIEPINPL